MVQENEWMHHLDLEWLMRNAEGLDTFAEVGCWKGLTTARLAPLVNTYYAIDTWAGSGDPGDATFGVDKDSLFDEFLDNTKDLKNLVIVRHDSALAVEHVPKVEVAFIDADHRYEMVVRDIKAWSESATKMICGHDANMESVRQAVIDTLGVKAIKEGSAIWRVRL